MCPPTFCRVYAAQMLVTSRRRCGGRAGPWGCGSDPGRCCRPGTACLSDAPLGWCVPPHAWPWRRTFRATDDESAQPAEKKETGKKKIVMSVTFRPGSAQQTGPSRDQEPQRTKQGNSLISRKAGPLLRCCFWVNTRPSQSERDLEQASADAEKPV